MAAFILQSPAQICINKFSGIRYKGTTYDTFPRSIVTANNEIISAGGLYNYNNAGHIAKYSEKGNLLWSYTYTIDFYDFVKSIFFQTVHFTDIVSTADGGFIAAGNVEQVLSPFGLPPPVKKWALLSRIDKFGNVLWTKTLTSQGELSFTTIYQTADGDFIAYLATDNGKKQNPGDHSYGKILRLGANGQIKWSTFLFTYLFDAGGLGVNNKRAITQASNHNIILADVVHNTSPTGEIKEGNLHFLELDYATGKLNWETSYEYPAPSSDTAYCPDIINVKELPNGKFSFITTLYLPTNLGITFVKKGVNIITSNKGVVENVIAYTPSDRRLCRITDAAIDKNNGNRTLLFFKDDNSALLANIADDGQIVWKQGYNNSGGSYPVNCFSAGKNGYNIFMSNNHSLQFKLLITDATGTIDCENENADLIASPALLNYRYGDVLTDLSYHFDEYFDYAHPLKRTEEYPLIKTVDCQQTLACCTDIIDKNNVTNISICQGKSYMLPDSTVIQDSGLYYVTFKTLLGCDSVTFYKVKIDKDVSTLSIGNDTCLGGQRSLTLKATAGFDKYYWMNNFLPGNNSFSISQPGNYSVSVNNICGSKTDSIEIFEECDYKIYMPSAFTPNGNNKNDYFGISPFNKNKLINFSIYDRWGKLVFQTRNPAQTWDGTYKNEPMSAGAYIYYLEMIGLSGNKVSQKGYVMLIR